MPLSEVVETIFDPLTGSKQAGKDARRAANVQSAASEAGIGEQRRQFDISQQQAAPFRMAGVDAIEQQRILLGLGGFAAVDPNQQQRIDLESQIAQLQLQGGGVAKTTSLENLGRGFGATKDQNTGAEIALLQQQLSQIPEFVPDPNQLSAQQQQQQAFAQLSESPGQQFIRQRQEKALLRNAAATGGLGGGNVLSALNQQQAGFAQQDIQNQFARLGQLSGQGQASTQQIAQLGGQTASNIANLTGQAGAARASGILAPSQARAAGLGQVLSLGGQITGGLSAGGFFNSPTATPVA